MRYAYIKSSLYNISAESMRFYTGVTNVIFFNFLINNDFKGYNSFANASCKTILLNDNIYMVQRMVNAENTFYNMTSLLHLIGCFSDYKNPSLIKVFSNCKSLITLKFKELKHNVSFSDSPNLSIKSVLYMINGEAATSPITITLHADTYNRCMANADILAALEAHPNVSLASA